MKAKQLFPKGGKVLQNTITLKKFREINSLVTSFATTKHTVGKWKICSHQNFFPSNQLFSGLFRLSTKCVVFTKFLSKNRESKFP